MKSLIKKIKSAIQIFDERPVGLNDTDNAPVQQINITKKIVSIAVGDWKVQMPTYLLVDAIEKRLKATVSIKNKEARFYRGAAK